MTPLGLLLVVAALTCAACGVFGPGSRRSERTVVRLPGWIALASRCPVPGPAVRLVDRLISRDRVRLRLRAGGLAPTLAPRVARARIVIGALGICAVALLGPREVTWLMLAPPAGALVALVVDAQLAAIGRRRQRAITIAIPDLLDLLSISVEAGMAIEPALALSATKLDPPLGDEIAHTLADLEMGLPRRRAYLDLAERCGGGEVGALVGALLRAEELGAPVSVALADQADAARAAVREDLRSRAARATPKIQLVVALVMVPGAMLLIMGVLVLELAQQLGAVIG